MRKFGLIGRNISYSFSKKFFNTKFQTENIDAVYENFDINHISEFKTIIKSNPDLKGLNVTIPYKEEIIPYLDSIDNTAKTIGAVNTIRLTQKNELRGYNTDYYGFKQSIKPLLHSHHKRALILGTGGASKAIVHALKNLDIDFNFVSRTLKNNVTYTYNDLTIDIIKSHPIIINCTPLGTFPNIDQCPDIPYAGINKNHILYDLTYNPIKTKFLTLGEKQQATIKNGQEMLELQAKKAWIIWNK